MASGGRLFVISSPSGCGKTTVIRELLKRNPEFRGSVSATTRPPRSGEREGADYHFLSETEFDRKIASGEFYEWAVVHGRRYGTLKEQVNASLQKGTRLLLAIDVQGGLRVKEQLPDSVLIFLMPPSMHELENRLRERGTDSAESIRSRLEHAVQEMAVADRYDFRIVNDRLDRTVREIEALIRMKNHKPRGNHV
jgi:guanylate kinase